MVNVNTKFREVSYERVFKVISIAALAGLTFRRLFGTICVLEFKIGWLKVALMEKEADT